MNHFKVIYLNGQVVSCTFSFQAFVHFAWPYRSIPQGTVENNLGPDRLSGPKALDPNYHLPNAEQIQYVLCHWNWVFWHSFKLGDILFKVFVILFFPFIFHFFICMFRTISNSFATYDYLFFIFLSVFTETEFFYIYGVSSFT